jgi:hypothetical protein
VRLGRTRWRWWHSVGDPTPPVPTVFDMFWGPPSLGPAHDRFGSQSNDVNAATSFAAGADMNALSSTLQAGDVLQISRASNPALFFQITVSDPPQSQSGDTWYLIDATKTSGSFGPANGEAIKVAKI